MSDGTPEGTVLIADINPGPSDSDPRIFRMINGAPLLQRLRADDRDRALESWGSLSRCGNGTLEPGGGVRTTGNVSDGDCCSSACRFEPSGTPCPDDGNLCTADQCDGAGTCGASCWAHTRLPAGAIRRCFAPPQGTVSLVRRTGLEWTWTSSTATPEGGLRDADDNEQLYPLRIRDGGGAGRSYS